MCEKGLILPFLAHYLKQRPKGKSSGKAKLQAGGRGRVPLCGAGDQIKGHLPWRERAAPPGHQGGPAPKHS